jgi:hypothetical protein
VGDLARDVAANNHVTLAAAIGGTTHRQVFQSFQRIVARYAGQPLLRIERDTRLS